MAEKQLRWEAMNHDTEPLQPYHELVNYMPLPRGLLTEGLPSTALVVYAMLLDRATLSQRNGWHDETGVYTVYPNDALALDIGKSVAAVKRALQQLEQAGYIRRDASRHGRANHIYLMVPGFTVMTDEAHRTVPPPPSPYGPLIGPGGWLEHAMK